MRARTSIAVGTGATVLVGFGTLAVLTRPATSSLVFVVALPLLAAPGLLLAGLLPRLPRERGQLPAIFLVGALVRLFFLGHTPLLSDDAYRYLWDGRVQLAGHSPYGVAPEADELDHVEVGFADEERVRGLVNHPDVPTIYPPVLELCFALVAHLSGGLIGWRLLLLGAELLIALLLARALAQRRRDPRLVALYLWHPLPVVESAWSAHAEAVAVCAFVAAVVALDRGRPLRGAVAVGLGGAAKLLPFGLLVHVARRHGLRWLPIALGVAAISALPYLGTDLGRATDGLSAYAERWYFNDIVFRPVGALLGLDPEDRTLLSTRVWRLALQGLWLAICVVAGLRARRASRCALLLAAAFVLLTPTLHPWYLLWLLPLAILEGSLAGVLVSTTVLFAYATQDLYLSTGVWHELPLVRVLEFAPAVGIGVWEYARWRRKRFERWQEAE